MVDITELYHSASSFECLMLEKQRNFYGLPVEESFHPWCMGLAHEILVAIRNPKFEHSDVDQFRWEFAECCAWILKYSKDEEPNDRKLCAELGLIAIADHIGQSDEFSFSYYSVLFKILKWGKTALLESISSDVYNKIFFVACSAISKMEQYDPRICDMFIDEESAANEFNNTISLPISQDEAFITLSTVVLNLKSKY